MDERKENEDLKKCFEVNLLYEMEENFEMIDLSSRMQFITYVKRFRMILTTVKQNL